MFSFLKNFFNELYQFRKFLKLNEEQKKISKRDLILVIAVGYPKKGNKMNLTQIHKVNDLVNSFRW